MTVQITLYNKGTIYDSQDNYGMNKHFVNYLLVFNSQKLSNLCLYCCPTSSKFHQTINDAMSSFHLLLLGIPFPDTHGLTETRAPILPFRMIMHSSYASQGQSVIATAIRPFNYRKTSSISRTKSQNLNVSCILLQLFSLNPLKPGVKLRMKM